MYDASRDCNFAIIVGVDTFARSNFVQDAPRNNLEKLVVLLVFSTKEPFVTSSLLGLAGNTYDSAAVSIVALKHLAKW